MKFRKIALVIGIIFVLYLPISFIYTRFCLDEYKIDGDTLRMNDSIYVRKNSLSGLDTENLGGLVGIAVEGERTMNDYIWPKWVIEYKNDKEHNRIFVRGLMDLGTVYEKEGK